MIVTPRRYAPPGHQLLEPPRHFRIERRQKLVEHLHDGHPGAEQAEDPGELHATTPPPMTTSDSGTRSRARMVSCPSAR
jgi:hypothetical protein